MIVYKIQNKTNNKIYVGKTTFSLEKRVDEHFKGGFYLFKALRKYGKDNFTFTILDHVDSEEMLNTKEKEYIKLYNSKAPFGYNLTDGGDGAKGLKWTEESRKRFSESKIGIKLMPFTDEHCRRISESKKGKQLSDEHKIKISEGGKGLTRPPRTKEWLRKQSEIHLGKCLSEETKKKLSEIKKGENNPFFGKCHSEATKQKISEKISGKYHSEESKQKIKESMKRYQEIRKGVTNGTINFNNCNWGNLSKNSTINTSEY